MRHASIGLGAFLFLAAAPVAAGPFTQPNGQTIPALPGCDYGKPGGLWGAFACVCTQPNICNIGGPCTDANDPASCPNGQNGTCETTGTHIPNDNNCIPFNWSGLHPRNDAEITPETFHPSCPLTFDLVTRGGALFKDAFGWYNATGQKPDLSDLHVMQDCNATAGQSVVLDLASEPDYKGGDVGFFLVTPESHTQGGTCGGGDCCATLARVQNGVGYVYYSERKYNPDYAGADSYIHLLIYQSKVPAWPKKFYFAWEDIYGGSNGSFTDIVSGVSGIQCSGGGVACDTGKQGVCAKGITKCQASTLGCVQLFQPEAEQCNGVDDDCDGTIDDDAQCGADEVCFHGTCVHECSDKEFPCVTGLVCDAPSHFCLDPACLGVTCESGQVCRHGQCGAPCEGVVCPHGQDCVNDQCVDLCAGVSCGVGHVCRQGVCFADCKSCDGISCTAPMKCDTTTGQCADLSCTAGCSGGTVCNNGQCVDACTGVVCPPGQTCNAGMCSYTGTTDGGWGGFDPGSGGTGTVTTSTNPTGNGGSGGAGGDAGSSEGSSSGCSCAAGVENTRNAAAALLGLALLGRRRARRDKNGAARG